MEEKELEQLVFTNVDFAKLDKEHVYVFRVAQEYLNEVPRENVEELCKGLKKFLDGLDIKYFIMVGDVFEITELVK